MTWQARYLIPPLTCASYTGKGKARKKTGQTTPKLVGYYTKGARPNWTRMTEYHDWKDHVRTHVRDQLPQPTKDCPVRVDVTCYFPNGTHADPENVRKGIVDALFPGGDKHVYGYHHFPQYDPADPRVLVEITVTPHADTVESILTARSARYAGTQRRKA